MNVIEIIKGTDFDMDFSFEKSLPDNWRGFNKKYIFILSLIKKYNVPELIWRVKFKPNSTTIALKPIIAFYVFIIF